MVPALPVSSLLLPELPHAASTAASTTPIASIRMERLVVMRGVSLAR